MTESDVKALPLKETKYVKSTGQGLLVEIHPNGSKYWIWQYLFPPSRKGKRESIHLGTFCNASGVVMPLKAASLTEIFTWNSPPHLFSLRATRKGGTSFQSVREGRGFDT